MRSFDPTAATKRRGPGRPSKTDEDGMDNARMTDWEMVKAGGGMDNNPQPSPFDEVCICQRVSEHVSVCQHMSACVSTCQRVSAYVSVSASV